MTQFSWRILVLILLLLPSAASLAQTFSYDGNRWYEIEVSIFSASDSPGEGSRELVIPEKLDLSYPEPIRQLVPASSSFSVPFTTPPSQGPAASVANTSPLGPDVLAENQPASIGPETRPEENSFRLVDFTRDPFIALGEEQAQFTDYNNDIIRSPDHRLLYHAVWRQPVLNRVQATALFVSGGNQYGNHHELEGSLRFYFNGNRVDVNARLWLMTFAPLTDASSGVDTRADTNTLSGSGTVVSRWQVPTPPFRSPQDKNSPGRSYIIRDLAYLEQVRPMISNELHYLDHPDMGMLVQIRPYQLPEPANSGFE